MDALALAIPLLLLFVAGTAIFGLYYLAFILLRMFLLHVLRLHRQEQWQELQAVLATQGKPIPIPDPHFALRYIKPPVAMRAKRSQQRRFKLSVPDWLTAHMAPPTPPTNVPPPQPSANFSRAWQDLTAGQPTPEDDRRFRPR